MDIKQAANIMDGQLHGRRVEGARFRGASIDSRTITPGALFFAIRGERLNGRQFIGSAISSGASGVVLSSSDRAKDGDLPVPSILVPDTHASLIDLAKWWRKELDIPTVGVTGSVGKTTVKEMIGHLLRSANLNPYVSEGNLNNLYGLPLSILRVENENRCGVFELGISRQGEMAKLAPILSPHVGVITNISRAHTDSLGDVNEIRAEKGVLLDNLSAGKVAVVPSDDHELLSYARSLGLNMVSFTATPGISADVVASDVRVVGRSGEMKSTACNIDGVPVTLNAFGLHQAHNAACAVAACKALGYEINPSALESYEQDKNGLRGELVTFSNIRVYLDCYNANLESMKSGIVSFSESLDEREEQSAILVLGDMLELGDVSREEHRRLADIIHQTFGDMPKRALLKAVVLLGDDVAYTAERLSELGGEVAPVTHCSAHSEAVETLVRIVSPGDSVYFKASRGLALELVCEELSKRVGREK